MTVAIWQLVLSGLGLVAVGWALVYSARTNRIAAEANRQTAQISIDERRPWISVAVSKAKVLIGVDGNDYATITFQLKNVGQNPATGIEIGGEGVKRDERYALSVADRLIREAQEMDASHGVRAMGISLFPGESATLGRVYTVYRTSAMAGAQVSGYVEYHSSLTGKIHYTPWSYEVRYALDTPETEVKASVVKFYLTTSPT